MTCDAIAKEWKLTWSVEKEAIPQNMDMSDEMKSNRNSAYEVLLPSFLARRWLRLGHPQSWSFPMALSTQPSDAPCRSIFGRSYQFPRLDMHCSTMRRTLLATLGRDRSILVWFGGCHSFRTSRSELRIHAFCATIHRPFLDGSVLSPGEMRWRNQMELLRHLSACSHWRSSRYVRVHWKGVVMKRGWKREERQLPKNWHEKLPKFTPNGLLRNTDQISSTMLLLYLDKITYWKAKPSIT